MNQYKGVDSEKDSKFKPIKDKDEAAKNIGKHAIVTGQHVPFVIDGVTTKGVLDKDGIMHPFSNVSLVDGDKWEHPMKGKPAWDIEVKKGEHQLKDDEPQDLLTGKKKK